MNLTNKTYLITGGGSGIGLEIAKQLNSKGLKTIILGRNKQKLENAAKGLSHVIARQCDITNDADVNSLANWIKAEHGGIDVLINNAAAEGQLFTHGAGAGAFARAQQEFLTNYFSVIRLNELLLPTLESRTEAAIVNVSSILAFTPAHSLPTYSDTKAALHSYTQSLRHHLAAGGKVQVFELMPPLVNTAFSKEIGGEQHGMPAEDVALQLMDGLENNIHEIHVGMTAGFYSNFFASSAPAFNVINARRG